MSVVRSEQGLWHHSYVSIREKHYVSLSIFFFSSYSRRNASTADVEIFSDVMADAIVFFFMTNDETRKKKKQSEKKSVRIYLTESQTTSYQLASRYSIICIHIIPSSSCCREFSVGGSILLH